MILVFPKTWLELEKFMQCVGTRFSQDSDLFCYYSLMSSYFQYYCYLAPLSVCIPPFTAQITASYMSLFCPPFYAAVSHVPWANILTTEITSIAPGHATSTLREQQQSRLQPSRLNVVPGCVITEYVMGMQGHLDLQSQVLALQLTASSIIDRGKPIRTICSPQRSARAA